MMDRRSVLKAAALLPAALTLPGFAIAQTGSSILLVGPFANVEDLSRAATVYSEVVITKSLTECIDGAQSLAEEKSTFSTLVTPVSYPLVISNLRSTRVRLQNEHLLSNSLCLLEWETSMEEQLKS